MALATGLSLPTYWRLERGRIDNPPIRYLVNCAVVLECELMDVMEEKYLQWLPVAGQAPSAPEPARRIGLKGAEQRRRRS